MIYQYGKQPSLRDQDLSALPMCDVYESRLARGVVGVRHFYLTEDVSSVPSSGNRVSVESLLFRTTFFSGMNTYIAIDVNISAWLDSSALAGGSLPDMAVHLYVDGLPYERMMMSHSNSSTGEVQMSMQADYYELGEGPHVLELRWSTYNGADNSAGGGTAICNASSDQYAHGCSVTIVEHA